MDGIGWRNFSVCISLEFLLLCHQLQLISQIFDGFSKNRKRTIFEYYWISFSVRILSSSSFFIKKISLFHIHETSARPIHKLGAEAFVIPLEIEGKTNHMCLECYSYRFHRSSLDRFTNLCENKVRKA